MPYRSSYEEIIDVGNTPFKDGAEFVRMFVVPNAAWLEDLNKQTNGEVEKALNAIWTNIQNGVDYTPYEVVNIFRTGELEAHSKSVVARPVLSKLNEALKNGR